MAYPCRTGIKTECDGCGYCEKEQEECPHCQETEYEYLYKREDGEIVGFDDETAADTKGYKTPKEYWENEDLEGLKTKLAKMFEDTNKNICTSDCNK